MESYLYPTLIEKGPDGNFFCYPLDFKLWTYGQTEVEAITRAQNSIVQVLDEILEEGGVAPKASELALITPPKGQKVVQLQCAANFKVMNNAAPGKRAKVPFAAL